MKKLLYICERGEFAGSFQSQRPKNLLRLFERCGLTVDTLSSSAHCHETTNRHQKTHGKRFLVKPLMPVRGNFSRFVNSFHFGIYSMKYLSQDYDIILVSQPDPISNIGILLKPKLRGTEYFVDVRDDWPRTLSFLGNKSASLSVYILILKFVQAKLAKKIDKSLTSLPFYRFFSKPTLHVPTLTSGVRAKAPKSVDNEKVTILYAGGFTEQSGISVLIKLIELVAKKDRQNLLKFCFFGSGKKSPIVRNLDALGIDFVINDKIEYDSLLEKSYMFDIGLLSFNDWSIYESGLNSNRLSFYLDAQIIPFVIANHMFEPQVETKLLKFRQDQLEKASEKLIHVAKKILVNRPQYFHRKHDLFISRSIDHYVPIIEPFFQTKRL